MKPTLTVNIGHHSYPIFIGHHLLVQQELFMPYIQGHQVLIVTQENIATHYLDLLLKQLNHHQVNVCILPSGEQYKNLSEWQKIIDTLLQKNHERSTTLIALGGGMVGDMAGFAAACYLRGVNYLQIPTSLIAQVDSAVGGKTGINHSLGKNTIGSFYHPQCVLIDLAVLKTLPRREFVAGMAEVIKYALINDANFFQWLEENCDAVLNLQENALFHMVLHSVKTKVNFVTQDEKDVGLRQFLNFGHTFGHAIETASSYQNILHGEAVALGMSMAVELSQRILQLPVSTANRINNLLRRYGLPVWAGSSLSSNEEFQRWLPHLKRDKKVQQEKIHFILLEDIGQAVKREVKKEKLENLSVFI